MKNKLLVLLGPTGVGKTELSIELAEKLGSEIISADSRQFYRELNIGTAVPGIDLLNRVKHHFIKFISINDYYSASMFERDVLDLLAELFSRSNIVIMAGGSGMYIDAVCNGIDNIPDTDPEIREKYIKLYNEEGIAGLRVALKLLDPVHYSKVDLKNYKRIIRALEICETTGMPYSSFLKQEKIPREFEVIKIGLKRDRDELYERINSRVDTMIKEGLEDEARSLYSSRYLNALNTVGYRELFGYFEGSVSRDKAIELIKRNTRRYSKRQMTWWAKDGSIRWFHPDEKERFFEIISGL